MAKRRPNILFLLNDHQAHYRHGWDGGVRPQRPAFDRLAAGGVRFERAYCVTPLCVPARRSMLTGLLPHNHGLITNDETALARDQGILLDLLRDGGYRTFAYGKWHAGPGCAKDYGAKGMSYPGFGNPYTTPEYAAYCEELGLPPASFNVEHVFTRPLSPGDVRPGPGYRSLEDEHHAKATGELETPPETHDAAFVAALAERQLEQLAANPGDEPWFMRVDFYGPHAPYFCSPAYRALYNPDEIAEYGSFRDDLAGKPSVWWRETNEPFAEGNRLKQPSPLAWSEYARILTYVYGHITEVDAAGGRVLAALDRLGLAEDTLVIWTSDHGDPVASHGGRLGKEAYMSEEVLRIPMAVRWPGHLAAGQTRGELVSNLDVPCTIAEAAGVAFGGPVDGSSMLGMLANVSGWRNDLMCETHGHHGEKVVGRTLVTRTFKYTRYYHDDVGRYESELYDLVRDPYQLHNLVRDPLYVEVAADLRRRLGVWRERTGDRDGPPVR